jgi:3',5'-cyclic-AMP phosphodiesterase
MISRRKLLKLFGMGTVGAGMLPISCAVPNATDETKRKPVLRFAHVTDMHLLNLDSFSRGRG